MLSAEHFRELYQKLPQGFSAELLSPFDLLRLVSEGRWSRAYLEKSADGLMVYLLEPNNHVLRQLKVGAAIPHACWPGEARRPAAPWRICPAFRIASTRPSGFSPCWHPCQRTCNAA